MTHNWYLIVLLVTGAAIPLTRLSPKKRFVLPGFCLGFGGLAFLLIHVVPSVHKPFQYLMVWVCGMVCGALIVKAVIELRRARAVN